MSYKKQIVDLIGVLNHEHGTTTSLTIENGCYWLSNPDGSHYNPFSSDGKQPARSGTGLYLYLIGLSDASRL